MSPTAKLFCCLMFVTFLDSDCRVAPSSPVDFPFHQPRKLNQLSHRRVCAVQQPVVECAHAQSKASVCVGMWAVMPTCAVTRLSGYPQYVGLPAVCSVIRGTASLRNYPVIQLSVIKPICAVTWLFRYPWHGLPAQ